MPVKTSEPMIAENLLEWGPLQLGDLVQFDVPEAAWKHHHWAIYAGDRKIIHFTTKAENTSTILNKKGSSNDSYRLFKDSLVTYAGDTLVRIHNWADEGYFVKKWFWQQPTKIEVKPFPPEEIVQRAENFLKDNKQSYDIFKNNCEVFVTLCRYGHGFSGQSIGFGWGLGGWYQ